MREFKFRAHEKHSGWYSRRFTMENLGELINDKNVTILQFTGLQDKNAVDIYEGDILDIGYNGLGTIAVEYNDGHFNISKYNWNKCEVIGNIHQI